MMAAATAQIPGPALVAGLLLMHMACCQPAVLQSRVYSVFQVAHAARRLIYEAMAGRQFSVCRYAHITRARAAGVGAMRAFGNFFQGIDHIQERETFTCKHMLFEYQAAGDHALQQLLQVLWCHFTFAVAGA